MNPDQIREAKMKLRKIMCLIGLMAVWSLGAHATEKVIYGQDDRLDVYEVLNPQLVDLANSTAAMVPVKDISGGVFGYNVTSGSLADAGICADEKFANQPTAAMCSGFLVGPDLLVTAGHCMEKSPGDDPCVKAKWIFDYRMDSEDTPIMSFLENQVYSCKEVVEFVLNDTNDYALVRLDRVVEGRNPLKFRTEGKVSDDAQIVVIGHPTGLPTKVAAGAYVRNNTIADYFVANLDTFGGNSGSAVFDLESGLVEGILVRGEKDYIFDYTSWCYRPNKCLNDGCRGEDVTRITNIEFLKNL